MTAPVALSRRFGARPRYRTGVSGNQLPLYFSENGQTVRRTADGDAKIPGVRVDKMDR